jgi:hypothetical protein
MGHSCNNSVTADIMVADLCHLCFRAAKRKVENEQVKMAGRGAKTRFLSRTQAPAGRDFRNKTAGRAAKTSL